MRRIERLFEPANYDAGDAPVTVEAPAPVTVETVARDDKRLGTVLAPGDRTAVVAWNGFEQATIVEIPAEVELDAPVRINVSEVEGTRAQHIVIRAAAFSKEPSILVAHGLGSGRPQPDRRGRGWRQLQPDRRVAAGVG